jgi:hypothetical protein
MRELVFRKDSLKVFVADGLEEGRAFAQGMFSIEQSHPLNG